jgi:hypothetical protein
MIKYTWHQAADGEKVSLLFGDNCAPKTKRGSCDVSHDDYIRMNTCRTPVYDVELISQISDFWIVFLFHNLPKASLN